MLQSKDNHLAFINIVMLRTETLANGAQRNAVRHGRIKLEDSLNAGQEFIGLKCHVFATGIAQSCALYEVLQVLRHIDIAILQYWQQLHDSIIDQILYARFDQIRFHIRLSSYASYVINAVDVWQYLQADLWNKSESF